jgi:hypothetical protein
VVTPIKMCRGEGGTEPLLGQIAHRLVDIAVN